MTLPNFIRALALAVCAATVTYAYAAGVSGAGATFPFPIYAKWADMYNKDTGFGLNYQSIGSGGGIKQIKAKTVTFGASDMPLEPKDLTASGLTQLPTVMGGDVPVVNLAGIAPAISCSTVRLWPISSLARSPSGTIRRSRNSTRTPNFLDRDRHRASLRRLGHDLHLH